MNERPDTELSPELTQEIIRRIGRFIEVQRAHTEKLNAMLGLKSIDTDLAKDQIDAIQLIIDFELETTKYMDSLGKAAANLLEGERAMIAELDRTISESHDVVCKSLIEIRDSFPNLRLSRMTLDELGSSIRTMAKEKLVFGTEESIRNFAKDMTDLEFAILAIG